MWYNIFHLRGADRCTIKNERGRYYMEGMVVIFFLAVLFMVMRLDVNTGLTDGKKNGAPAGNRNAKKTTKENNPQQPKASTQKRPLYRYR